MPGCQNTTSGLQNCLPLHFGFCLPVSGAYGARVCVPTCRAFLDMGIAGRMSMEAECIGQKMSVSAHGRSPRANFRALCGRMVCLTVSLCYSIWLLLALCPTNLHMTSDVSTSTRMMPEKIGMAIALGSTSFRAANTTISYEMG